MLETISGRRTVPKSIRVRKLDTFALLHETARKLDAFSYEFCVSGGNENLNTCMAGGALLWLAETAQTLGANLPDFHVSSGNTNFKTFRTPN